MSEEVTNQDILDRIDEFEDRVEQVEAKFDRKSRLMEELYEKVEGKL